jgi:tetratricopeptide (TPR) repeat protein
MPTLPIEVNRISSTSLGPNVMSLNCVPNSTVLFRAPRPALGPNKRTEPSFHKAIQYFNQAIDKDPSYALAYAGLADCHALLSVWGGQPPNDALTMAEAAALRATALDNTLSEAHTSLAFAKWIYDRDWASAEREFQEAIRLKPAYPTAHHWYSYFLAAMGRFDEAITQIKQARDLDELSPSINTDVEEIYCWARR